MSSERKIRNGIENATNEEIYAALKLIECLYLQGEIPKHVYQGICKEYGGKLRTRIPKKFFNLRRIISNKIRNPPSTLI